MKKHPLLMTLAMITVIAISLPSPAAAKDAVTAAVSVIQPQDKLVAVMVNGNPTSPGTFAVGTIQLFYEATLSELNTLNISFDLTLGIKPSATSKGQNTLYPATVEVAPVGSDHYLMTPNPHSVTFTSAADDEDHTNIQLSLTNLDGVEVGDDLVANLRMQVTENGHFLDTLTNIQVHVLVVDGAACVQVFNFLTDMEFTALLSSIDISVSNSKKDGPQIRGTNPGQLSDNVLVVNNCAQPQTFDLQINLDSHFEVKGNNAVATYLAGGYSDPSNFDITIFGEGTKHGQNLLLTEITLPPVSSFLATVHIGLITGGSPDTLPASGLFEGFLDELLVAGTSGTLAPPIRFTLADPNPATATLGFTIK